MTLWSLLSLLLFEMVTASHLLVHFFALSGKKQCTSGTFSMPYSEKYGQYAKKYKATMPIRRKPGEIMEVDWAGSTLVITDRAAGENLRCISLWRHCRIVNIAMWKRSFI